jgi:hypothetical protein
MDDMSAAPAEGGKPNGESVIAGRDVGGSSGVGGSSVGSTEVLLADGMLCPLAIWFIIC